jgi:hypothetical protein
MPDAADPLAALLADLEAVDWRHVDGVSASTAAAFSESLRDAEVVLPDGGEA